MFPPSEEAPIANLAPSVKIINLSSESLMPDSTLELRFSKGVNLTESSFEVVCSTVSQRTIVPLLFSVGLPASGVTSLNLKAELEWLLRLMWVLNLRVLPCRPAVSSWL